VFSNFLLTSELGCIGRVNDAHNCQLCYRLVNPTIVAPLRYDAVVLVTGRSFEYPFLCWVAFVPVGTLLGI
jgi:hypothetical protein